MEEIRAIKQRDHYMKESWKYFPAFFFLMMNFVEHNSWLENFQAWQKLNNPLIQSPRRRTHTVQLTKKSFICWYCNKPEHACDMCLAEGWIFCYGCVANSAQPTSNVRKLEGVHLFRQQTKGPLDTAVVSYPITTDYSQHSSALLKQAVASKIFDVHPRNISDRSTSG